MGYERTAVFGAKSEGGRGTNKPVNMQLYQSYNCLNISIGKFELDIMKKLVFCFLSVTIIFSACLKKETGCPSQSNLVAPISEQQSIADYLSANNINATKHSSGLYYQIWNKGNGDHPNNCSSILIKYSGHLSNGSQFDQSDNFASTLGSLIEGWQIGLPLIQKGGKIKLYIPPSLGYGSSEIKDMNGTVVIPANSMLIFDISLLDIQ